MTACAVQAMHGRGNRVAVPLGTRGGPVPCAWCHGGAVIWRPQYSTATPWCVTTRHWPMQARSLRRRRTRLRGPLLGAPQCSVTPTPGRDGDDEAGEGEQDMRVDMDLLRRRIREVETSGNDADASSADSDDVTSVEVTMDLSRDAGATSSEEAMRVIDAFENIRELYVIVFKSVDRQEGVYSLEIGHENVVLAFQERNEAQQYATLLEMKKFPTAKVCRLESSELREFCKREGYRLGFVPRGAVGVKPPDESGIDDPERWGITEAGQSNANAQSEKEKDQYDGSSGLSKDELELMKRRLDSLFGGGTTDTDLGGE